MNPPRPRLFLPLLFAVALIQGLFAGDSVTFPSFSTGTITRGSTGVSTALNVSAVPAIPYLYASVSGDFVPGPAGSDIFSTNLNMELSDGVSTVYWTATTPTQGARQGTTDAEWRGTASPKWYGPLPKTYTGGTPLRVKFFSESGTGAFTGAMNNVVVTIHPSTPVKTFTTFNSGVMTGAGAAVTQSLDVTGMSGEYFILKVIGTFAPGANPAYSNTIQMELNNGGSTIYQPYARATFGQINGPAATTLEWHATMPVSYTGGPLSISFKDPFTDATGPYTSRLNNVSVRLYPVSTPVKTFTSYNSGLLTGGSSVSKVLDVTGIPATDYFHATVTGDFVPNSNAAISAYSQTIQLELNNGGSTVYLPPVNATFGALPNASATKLKWTTVLPKAYVGGGPLTAKFIDTYSTGGTYTSNINNVVVTLQPSFTSATTVTSLNRVNATPSNASAVNWTLTFPTAVTGVTSSNFSLSPTVTGAIIGTPTTGNGGLTWNIPVTGITGDGSLQLNLANTTSLSPTVSTAMPFNGQPYAIDRTAPTISVGAPSATLTNSGSVSYTVTYADANFASSTLAPGNITLNKGGSANGNVAVTGSGTTRTVTISGITGDGTLGISIAAGTATDTAGNSAPASAASTTFAVDNTAPTLSIAAPSVTGTKSGPVTYLVTYADANFASSTLGTVNITLNKGGSANGNVAVTGSGTTRTVTISGITGDGTLGISIAAGTATDTAGNSAPASAASATFAVDNTPPVITSGNTAAGTYQSTFSIYTIIASGSPATYSTSPLPAGLSLAGAVISGTPSVTGTFPVTVSATDALGNTGSATLTITIGKATATVTLDNLTLTQTYNGSARPVTATTVPAGLTVDFTYNGSSTVPVNAGTYSISAAINNSNYQGTATGSLVVSKASATVTLAGLAQTYNASPRPVSATTVPAGLTVTFTYDGLPAVPTNAGSYLVAGTISDTNYQGSSTSTLVVGKATATVTLAGLAQTYNASPSPASSTSVPAGLTVNFTYDGLPAAPTNAGNYLVAGTVSDTNYQGSSTGTLVVGKATAPVTLGGLAQAYNGSPRIVTAVTVPAGLTVDFTYDGLPAAPNNAGSYPVVGTISNSNYQGTASGSLEVSKVLLTVTPNAASRSFGTSNPTFDFGLTGFVGTDGPSAVSGSPAIVTTAGPTSPPGDYPLTATIGTLAATNYSFTFTPSTLTITPGNVDDWKNLHFTEEELENDSISGLDADADGDGIINLLEMAFGTDPRDTVSGPAPVGYTGTLAGNGTLATPGQPITMFEPSGTGVDFRAVFVRRNPALFSGGLIYTPQFSADLITWQSSTAIPVVLATSGDLQVVSVPYPMFVGGKKARFFRITVTLAP